MRKTKIIIPALGMLLLSTVATVSGSVAWFTANRAVEMNTNQFEIVATQGSLEVAATAIAGTTVTANGKTVNIREGYTLTNASFDFATEKLFSDVLDDDGDQPTAWIERSTLTAASDTAWLNGTGTTVYYAVAWELTFTYTFSAGNTDDVDLFFNFQESLATPTQTEAATNSSAFTTSKGFRIAFIGQTENQTKNIVWAPNRTKLDTIGGVNNTNNRVTSTTGTTDYTDAQIIYSDNALAGEANKAKDPATAADVTANTQRIDHIGVLKKAESGKTGSISFKCVAWYEGGDNNVVNGSQMVKIASTLKFYVRNTVPSNVA